MRADLQIPRKANRVLNLILLAFILIFIRVWYLGSIQQEELAIEARKPQRKTVIDRIERATIRDRFNIPLAQNTIQYNAAVRYAELREIPSGVWQIDESGKKVRIPKRSLYISSLAEKLSKELSMDPQIIEDTIHAKASLFPHTPFVIKEHLTEEEYYRILALEKDWPGIEAQRTARRVYPQGKVACDVVGFMGAISQKEYLQIAEEIKTLQEYIQKREAGEMAFLPPGYNDPLSARKRLYELKEKAYTLNDWVGKTGIESTFDEELRGTHGRKRYEIDPKGNILRELPGAKKSLSGQRVFLSISAELQQFAEELLAMNEGLRIKNDPSGQPQPGQPWIRGGAIVALDPKTGEVLTLASYPRFDPNDFISSPAAENKKRQQESVLRWVESERYVGNIWDGKASLSRERFSFTSRQWLEEKADLTWDLYLSTVLPPASLPLNAIKQTQTLELAYSLQKSANALLKLADPCDLHTLLHALYSSTPHISTKKSLSTEQIEWVLAKLRDEQDLATPHIERLHRVLAEVPHNDDKILILDLCKLLVDTERFDAPLIEAIGSTSLSTYFSLTQAFSQIHDAVRKQVQNLHHQRDFQTWREQHFKELLKQKRKEEKAEKKYALPYTEYLDRVEKVLFQEFWQTCKFIFLDAFIHGTVRISMDSYPQLSPYLDMLLEFRKESSEAVSLADYLKEHTALLSPSLAIQYLKTMRSFEELTRPLYGKYRYLRNTKGVQLEKHLAGAFYPLSGFGYGRSQAFRQSTPAGSVFKIVIAYEALKERYAYLKEHHQSLEQLNPLTLIDQIQWDIKPGSPQQLLGYTLEGTPIRRLYKGGLLPRSHPNIGKIDLIGAIEQSSNIYFSLLAAEHVEDPSFLEKAAKEMGYGTRTGIELSGEIPGKIPQDLRENKTGLYSFAIGQHSLVVTPLQTATMLATVANYGKMFQPKIVHLTAGKQASEALSLSTENFPFQEALSLIGASFPLFTETLGIHTNPTIQQVIPTLKQTVFMPLEIRNLLLQGMSQVINGPKGTARPNIIRYLHQNPEAVKPYLNLKQHLVGKTGTAEIFYKPWIDAQSKAEIQNHIWFGGIAFTEGTQTPEDHWGEPDLVVVVYLRFSQAGGKEAAPLAAQIVEKWREIQKKHKGRSYLTLPTPGSSQTN